MSAAITDSSPPGQFYCPTCENNFEAGDRCPSDGTRLVRINVPIDPLLGRELDGRYVILQKLGQGGMGAVYRGSQLGLGREVAIKVVSSHLVSEPDVVKRFLREAKLASRLTHPNAVAVLDFNQTEDGLFYLVMELVAGRTLDKVFEERGALRPERVVRIGTQICDALDGAHALSIVHRDLKPSNVMVLAQGRDLVKVLDFGLAKSVAPDQTSTTMTGTGALLGTPAFMPPELALGEPCDGRADLYSLGVVLYLLGSGRLPFMSDSAHELIAMHASEPAPPMTGVPAPLANVIDRLLRKLPDERYQTAAEAREALEAALESSRAATATPPQGVPLTTGGTLGGTVSSPAAVTPIPHETPLPPSLIVANRRPRTASAAHAIATSETLAPGRIGSAGARAGARAGVHAPPVRTRRWWIPAVVVGVLSIGAVGFAVMRGSEDHSAARSGARGIEPPPGGEATGSGSVGVATQAGTLPGGTEAAPTGTAATGAATTGAGTTGTATTGAAATGAATTGAATTGAATTGAATTGAATTGAGTAGAGTETTASDGANAGSASAARDRARHPGAASSTTTATSKHGGAKPHHPGTATRPGDRTVPHRVHPEPPPVDPAKPAPPHAGSAALPF